MPIYRGPQKVTPMPGGVKPVKAYRGGRLVYSASLPVVVINGTFGTQSRDQFRAACVQFGTTYSAVAELPFQLDTSAATNLSQMFLQCANLVSVPPMDTSNVTDMKRMFEQCDRLAFVPDLATSEVTTINSMFYYCEALSDGNVRLIGKRSGVDVKWAIQASKLTRVPFFNASGQPI